MIPKIIHYCWLSNDPYPDKIKEVPGKLAPILTGL